YMSLHVISCCPARRSSDLHLQQCTAPARDQAVQAKPLRRDALVEYAAIGQFAAITHLHSAARGGFGTAAGAELGHQHAIGQRSRSEEHTSELQSRENLVCR